MDDLSEKLDRLLSSPDSLKQIGDLMAAFGGEAASPPSPAPEAAMPDLSQMMKLLPLLSGLQKDDDAAALLTALRPHLTKERQKRLDEAHQLLKMARLLPLLKELKGDDLFG